MKLHRWATCLSAIVLTLMLGGCGIGTVSVDDDDGEEEMSAEEKALVAAAKPFVDAIARRDYKAAYPLLAASAREGQTLERFVERQQKNEEEFGQPLSAKDLYVNETDSNVLAGINHKVAGEDQLDGALRVLEASRAVGDMPDEIAKGSRKASVCCDLAIKLDPVKHPEAAQPADGDDEQPVCILTVVLVDEGGSLKVGHHFLRWYSMLD